MRRPRGNEYRGPADLRCRGFTPGPNSEPEAKAGYLTIRFNTRFTCGAIHAPSPRAVRISLAWSPAAICLNDVAPSACSSAIGGAISAALADARCWRAAADCMRIFTVGLTPRSPPSCVPRALVAVIAAFVRTPNTRAAHAVLSNLVASVGRRWRRLPGMFAPQRAVIGRSIVTFIAPQGGVG